MSHQRNLKYLNKHRIVYRRHPINDIPDEVNEAYAYYINGTHECYELFRSRAKITTYKSLKWHLLVLWYLNPHLDQDDFMQLAEIICHKENGFISFAIHAQFYNHSDSYPEGLGIEIAKSLLDSIKVQGWEVEHLDTRHGDLEYVYYIWQAPLKTTFISIFEGMGNGLEFECIFVGEPQTLIDKYSQTK